MASQNYDQEIAQAIMRLALAGDGAVLGLSLAAIAVKTWLKFLKSSITLKILKSTPPSHIADLRSLLPPPESSSSNQASSCSSGSCKGDENLVIVRGKVQPASSVDRSFGSQGPIVAPNSGAKAVVFVKTQTCLYNEWRGVFGWSPDWRALFGGSLKEQVTTSVREVPFVLTENNGKGNLNYAHINLEDSKQPLPLTTVYHHLQPVQASPYTVFQAIFGRGYPIGLLDQEKILPPGKEITAIGHVSATLDGYPVIKSCNLLPYFLSELTKDQLVKEVEGGKGILLWSGILLSLAAAFVIGYSACRNWHKFKDWRHQRLRTHSREEAIPPTPGDEDPGDVPEGELCVICLGRRRRSAFIPCGHLVCCSACAQRVQRDSNPKCPVCRQSISNSVRIYDS
eukprot:TRINITY_DN5352_c0_g1_i1.p1 TRINITY_DN5352_c0_g1~~TRINITY_DN5352_c0_g1_i1.p1  ORF type:complete len:397 (+),score=79.54 TRINITY_DN5352_c0_g1_i1:241-1431(+)